MTASKFSRFLSVAIFSTSLLVVGGSSLPHSSKALGASSSWHVSGGSKHRRVNRKFRSHRGLRNRGFSRVHSRRSGVVLGSNKLRHRYFSSVNQRRRQIELRNRRVVLENHLQSERRARSVLANPHRNGALYYGNTRGTIVNDDPYSAGTQVIYRSNATNPCPASHNCGYRVYQNGTGPRIITPGVAVGGNLPAYDGLNGPVIITVE